MINRSKKLTGLILIFFLILFLGRSVQAYNRTESEVVVVTNNSDKQNNAISNVPSKKIRVIHTTDMGFDDKNSLVRMLLFANNQNIIGIMPSAGPWQNMIDKEYEGILEKIDLYARVYKNLKLHDPSYPSPEYLRSVTKHGNVDVTGDYPDHQYKLGKDTDGSMLIANALLDESDDSPIWVTCWGGPLTLTEALRYINDNYPEKKKYVTGKLKVFIIAAQYQDSKDRALTKYITDHYNPAPLIIDQSHWEYTNGWGEVKYWCNNVDYSTEEWVNANYNRNHGALCNSFVWKNKNNDDVDGDAAALLHILGSAFGLRSNENPSYGGWGGRFDSIPDQYKCYNSEDIVDAWSGPGKLPEGDPDRWTQDYCYDGARWADDFQNELAVRADWCVKSYDEANHAPKVNLLTPQDITASPGETIHLKCNPTDTDGDKVNCSWWQYKEAGTSDATVDIKGVKTKNASFVCKGKPGDTIHIILEVTDNGKNHPLTRYARVIITVKK